VRGSPYPASTEDFAEDENSQERCWPDAESPDRLVARFIVRGAVHRAVGSLPPVHHAAVMIGGYTPKLNELASRFHRYRVRTIGLHPYVAVGGPDKVADILDASGFSARHLVPLVDSVVEVVDTLNHRLRIPGNNPGSSRLRRNKFAQQDALRCTGLPSVEQCSATRVDEALPFLATHGTVVVKPKDSSGGDGVWLASSEQELRMVFSSELGKTNVEWGVNDALVVMQALIGEEWVVNTVSLDGVHKFTDAWCGPHKQHTTDGPGMPKQFIYDMQFLACECPRRSRVVAFTTAVLDALEARHGAAHTELVWAEGPALLEVNARLAGGLPRIPHRPDQLGVLAMSLCDPNAFHALPLEPPPLADEGARSAAVVFLRASKDGWMLGAALQEITELRTFARFERGLMGLKGPPLQAQPVQRATGLFLSPGTVVLHGAAAAIAEDAKSIRALEGRAYVTSLQKDKPAPDNDSTADATKETQVTQTSL